MTRAESNSPVNPFPGPANPFPGLRPFQTEEHHLFFGREDQTAALLGLLREQRFLSVVGTSGSGKSSLVRAGLIPALHRGTMSRTGSAWEVVVMRPAGNPITSLARALLEAGLYDREDPEGLHRLHATLTRSLYGLVEAVRQSDALEGDTNLLVVVDQFEELFRFRQQGMESEETAGAFVRLLLAAADDESSRIYIAITMRSDYLGDCSQIPGLAEAVNRGEYLIPRLSRDQRRDAIEKPVGVGGARIAPRLVQHMLNDLGDDPDQLPVLQHALMRTWDAWAAAHRDHEPIDLPHYESTGGMASALSRHADEVFAALGDDRRREVAERVFKALTQKGADNRGIRRPTRLSRLARIAGASEEAVAEIVDAYRRPGVTFLMPGHPTPLGPDTVIDLSHESLMRVWRRLSGWVEEEAQSARVYRRLAETAALWAKGEAGLYHDPDLQIARSWREQAGPNEAWAEQYGGGFEAALAFLDRSRQTAEAEERGREAARRRELEQARELAEAQRERLITQRRAAKRLKVLVAGLAVVAAIAVVAFFVAIEARQQAVSSANLAQTNALLAAAKEQAATQAAGQAERAAAELQRTLVASDFDRGAEAIAAGDGSDGLSYLARALRTDPSFWPAGARAMSALASGRFPLRAFDRIAQQKVITTYRWNEKEDLLFTSDATDEVSKPERFVWDGRTGKRLYEVAPGKRISKDVAWTEDGSTLVAYLMDEKTIRFWEGRTGREAGPPILTEGIEEFRLGQGSPADTLVLGRYSDGSLQVWKASTGEAAGPRLLRAAPTISQAGFTPDGRRVYGICADAVIAVWEASGGKLVAEISTRPYRTQESQDGPLIFSPDGRTLICRADGGKRVRWWSVDTGAPRCEWIELEDKVDVDFLPGANKVALVTSMSPGRPAVLRVAVHDLATGERTASIESPRPVTQAVYPLMDKSNLLRFAVLGCVDANMVRIWDLESGGLLRELFTPALLASAALSPEGRRILTISIGQELMVWDLFTGAQVIFGGLEHGGRLGAEFSPDGEKIITHDSDKSLLELWDSRTGERLLEPVELGYVSNVFYPAGGQSLLVWESVETTVGTRFRKQTTGQLHLIDAGRPPVLFEPLLDAGGRASRAQFTPGGRSMVTVGKSRPADPEGLTVWEADSHRRGRSIPFPVGSNIQYAIFRVSPDGGRVLVGSTDGRVRMWDLSSGELLKELVQASSITALSLNADGSRIATGTQRGKVCIWDSATGAPLWEPLDHGEQTIHEVVFSPDGTLLATGSLDFKFRLVDARTGEQKLEPMALGNVVREAAFSPDGTHVVPVVFDSELPIVEVSTGSIIRRLPHAEACRSARFSPDGALLAVGTGGRLDSPAGDVYLWSWRDGRKVSRLSPGGPVEHLEFSADGSLLVTGTIAAGRGAVRVWDVSSGKPLIDPIVGRDQVTSISLNPAGTDVVAAWQDGSVRVIDLPPRAVPQPEWLPRLAEAVARKRRIPGRGGVEEVPPKEAESIRAAIAARDPASGGAHDRWARWLLSDPEGRTISPGSAMSFKEYLTRLRRSDRLEDLREAVRLAPADALTYVRLGLVLHDSRALQPELAPQKDADQRLRQHWSETAAWYGRRAVELAPRDREVLALQAELLDRLGRKAEAAAVVAQAMELDPSRADAGSPNAAYMKATTLAWEGKWQEADAVFARALDMLSATPAGARAAEGSAPLLELLSSLEPREPPAEFRDIRLPAPIPGTFESFDSTPDGSVPPGWTARHEEMKTYRGFASSGSLHEARADLFDDWLAVSLERAASYEGAPFQASRSLQPGLHERVDGAFQVPLMKGRFLFALSALHDASHVQYLFTPDYDCSASQGVHVSFHSAYEQAGSAIASLEYSIDEGKTWLPVLYRIDSLDVLRDASGKVDAAATLGKGGYSVPLFIADDGRPAGTTFGEFIGAKISRDLDPYVEGLSRDSTGELNRVEVLRLPLADGQAKVRLRFNYTGRYGWYWGFDDFGLYEIPDGRAWRKPESLDSSRDPKVLALKGLGILLGRGPADAVLDPRTLAALPADEPVTAPPAPSGGDYRERRVVDGRLLIRRAAALAPDDPWIQLASAIASARAGAADEAVAAAVKALEREPASRLSAPALAAAFLSKGDALRNEGDTAGASVAYELAQVLSAGAGRTEPGILKRLAALGLAAEGQIFLPRRSEWRYLDDGSNPGPAWKDSSFDDGTWLSGKARLGYGGDGESTVVGFGPDMRQKHLTTYFRASFEIEDPGRFGQLRFHVQRDDGVVVYLNGREMARDNMPAGEIGPNTRAIAIMNEDAEEHGFHVFDLPADSLQKGRNVIATEVHQQAANSSDLGFDLELEGVGGLKEISLSAADLDAAEGRLGLPRELRSALWTSRADRFRRAGLLERASEAIDRAASLGAGDAIVAYQRAFLLKARGEESAGYEAYLQAGRAAISLKAGPRTSTALFLPETLKWSVEPIVRETGVAIAAAARRVALGTSPSREMDVAWLLRWSESLDPDSHDARRERAEALFALGKMEEVLAAADRALAATPGGILPPRALRERIEWLSLRERSLRRLGKVEEASQVTKEIFKIPPRDPALSPRLIDLSTHYNASLYDGRDWHSTETYFSLAETFKPRDGIAFDLRGLIQLNSGTYTQLHQHVTGKDFNAAYNRPYPDRVTGIRVGLSATALHFLSACAWGMDTKGVQVARIVVHYEDGGEIEIPLRMTEDVVDWAFAWPSARGLPPDRLAWLGGRVRRALMRKTWVNPTPEKVIREIDFISSRAEAAPFLVAVTAE